MLGATVKILLRDVVLFFLRFEEMLIALGAERRCAQRLDRMADRLLGLGARIDALRARMRHASTGAAMDADPSLRDALGSLKQEIREVRRQLASLDGAGLPPRLRRAFLRLSAIAEETYAGADRLQWEIADPGQAVTR